MISTIGICNKALAVLGHRSIVSFEDNTPEAIYCRQHYPFALNEVLRSHPWNFAQSREVLAQIDVPLEWSREYPLAYAYPASCLQLHRLIDQTGYARHEFTVAEQHGQKIVLTAIETPIASFTALVTDPGRYDALFVQALAMKMACYLAQPILKSGPQTMQSLERGYASALADAKTADAREGQPFSVPDSPWDGGHDNPWIRARLGAFRRG